MKTQLLAFFALLLFYTSCSPEDQDPVEKTASYDVYVMQNSFGTLKHIMSSFLSFFFIFYTMTSVVILIYVC